MAGFAFLPLMAASALVFPQPGDDLAKGTASFRQEQGLGVFRLFVAPDKQVVDCQTVYSDFEEGVAERICVRLLERDALEGAHGSDGEPIHGTMLYLVDQRGKGAAQQLGMRAVPVMEISVQSLPEEDEGRKSVPLQVQLDGAGKVIYCEPADGEGDAYTQIACELAEQTTLMARKGRNQAPVTYVDSITIDFVTE